MSMLAILVIISDVIFLTMFTISMILGYKIKEMCKGTKIYQVYGFFSEIFFHQNRYPNFFPVAIIRILPIIVILLCLSLPTPFLNIPIGAFELYFSYDCYKKIKKEFCENIMEKLTE